jgi:ribonuclease T2
MPEVVIGHPERVVSELRHKSRTQLLLLLLLFVLGLAACGPSIMSASDSAKLATSIAQQLPAVKPATAPAKNSDATTTPGKRVKNTPGDFDFYVLSLSWSPDFCAGSNVNDPQQCSVGKKLGFVLHGLWPQYNRGYPANCSNVKLPKDMQAKFSKLYPSSNLFTHEWGKHGTCSGLKPLDYLALSKSLKESIVIPAAYRQPVKSFRATSDDLKTAFVKANSTLSKDALAVQCSGSGRFLQELRVCFSREGEPVACSQELQQAETKSCDRADFLVRNVK